MFLLQTMSRQHLTFLSKKPSFLFWVISLWSKNKWTIQYQKISSIEMTIFSKPIKSITITDLKIIINISMNQSNKMFLNNHGIVNRILNDVKTLIVASWGKFILSRIIWSILQLKDVKVWIYVPYHFDHIFYLFLSSYKIKFQLLAYLLVDVLE